MSTYPAPSGRPQQTRGHRDRHSNRPVQRITGPGELVQAIPYLLGFHPAASLVLVGLAAGELVVTARLDLGDVSADASGDLAAHTLIADTVSAMHGGGSREIVAAVYDGGSVSSSNALGADDRAGAPAASDDRFGLPPALPWCDVALDVQQQAALIGCDVADVLFVTEDRWWSYTCGLAECCPPEGTPVPSTPSAFTAAATYAGVVALPDRASLAAVLEPRPDDERNTLSGRLAQAEDVAVAAVLRAHGTPNRRSAKRALFAAARDSGAPRWGGLPDAQVVRFAIALTDVGVRDAVWMAIDASRLDGRALWGDLARRLPAPYDAAPLFLFGWATWRDGDGALAGIAAERAVASDPGYTAADLLLAALAGGVDPRRFPRLRLPRSA